MTAALPAILMAGSAAYGAYSISRAKKPKMPTPSPAPARVNERQAIGARDDLIKRLAKLRRATVVSELSTPNIRRKQLGAGA